MNITHVIQTRITRIQQVQHCHCGKHALFLYTSYEVATEEQKNKVQFYARIAGSRAIDVTKRHPINNDVYNATLCEQQQGLPKVHMQSYDCYLCLAALISQGMGIPYFGEKMLLYIEENGALWIIRDVAAPDRWATFQTPYQDVALVGEDLRRASTVRITSL